MAQQTLDTQRKQHLTSQEARQALGQALEQLIERFGAEKLARLIECFEIVSGQKEPHYQDSLQRPALIYFPGLPTQAWYDPYAYESTRKVAQTLEREYPRIRQEVEALLGEQREAWTPYVAGEYTEQKFFPLKGNAWTSLLFRGAGENRPEARALCPSIARALDEIEPLLTEAGEVFLSRLEPGAVVPPHYSDSNISLTLHLPIIIPPDCAIRVGRETRTWTEGKCLMFDDTYEHEAWNRSDRTRVCLLLDVFHPGLTPEEIEAIRWLAPLVYGVSPQMRTKA